MVAGVLLVVNDSLLGRGPERRREAASAPDKGPVIAPRRSIDAFLVFRNEGRSFGRARSGDSTGQQGSTEAP